MQLILKYEMLVKFKSFGYK